MGLRRDRNISELIKRYELANLAGGKSPKTVRGYNDLLGALYRYLREHIGDTNISCFNIDTARQYVIYLQNRPKFQRSKTCSWR